MRPLAFSMLLMTITCGCGTTYQIGPGADSSQRQAFSQKLLGREVNVIRLNGSEVQGTFSNLDRDTLRLSREAASDQAIPYSDVRTVTSGYGFRTLGVVSGMMIGGAIGLVAGSALGKPDRSQPGMQFDFSGVTAPIGGVIGAGLGILAGFQTPPDETYLFLSSGQESPIVHVLVDQLKEEAEGYTRVRIGGQDYTLPKPEFELKKVMGTIYIGGSRESFRRIGITIP